jgi:hypothetical protein
LAWENRTQRLKCHYAEYSMHEQFFLVKINILPTMCHE